MSFHVVRRERANAIGDDVAVAHVGPPSDLSEARRAAIAFLAQGEKENAPR